MHTPEEAIKNWNEGNKGPRVFEAWVNIWDAKWAPHIFRIFDRKEDALDAPGLQSSGFLTTRKIRYTEGGKIEDVTDD